ELRKQKCHVCGRKQGAQVKCAHEGCTTHVHPLCAAHSNMYSRQLCAHEEGDASTLQFEIFCSEHIPRGLFCLSSGHWIDFHAAQRLRRDLDRARTVCDLVTKREKRKRTLWKGACEEYDVCIQLLKLRVPSRMETLVRYMAEDAAEAGIESREGGGHGGSSGTH
ncbi:unnamed protein product, partial [Choristocarpus tenellus]